MTSPHNRIALVTGAGSGIGRAAALALLADGWRVVFSGRRLEALRESIALAGDPFDDIHMRGLAVPADVTRPDSVAAMFDVVRARFGRLDLLFNNAGVTVPAAPLEKVSIEHWRAAVDTHLTGAFLCAQQAFRLMKTQVPRGGRIINRGSVPAQEPRPPAVACMATRHALNGLTRAAALEGRDHDIAVGQIDIGPLHAPGLDAQVEPALQASDSQRAQVPGSPSAQAGSSPSAQAGSSPSAQARVEVRHAAQAVVQMANLPIDTNVMFMTLLPTRMPFDEPA